MKKNCIISILGNEHCGTDETITFITKGKYYQQGDGHYISYKEVGLTETEEKVTTLRFSDDKVTMTRSGTSATQMTFEKDRRHTGYYETDYGSFTVNVFSRDVDIDLSPDGANIKIDYFLDVNNYGDVQRNLQIETRFIDKRDE